MSQLCREERETLIAYSSASPEIVEVDTSNLVAIKRLLRDRRFTVTSRCINNNYAGVDGKGLIGIKGYYKRTHFSVSKTMPLSKMKVKV